MVKNNKANLLFLIIYCSILIVTIYFIAVVVFGEIQKQIEYNLYKQSWQYVADTDFELVTEINNNGEKDTYYKISTPEQLAGMFSNDISSNVSADSLNDFKDSKSPEYRLTKNIDLSGRTWIGQSNNFNGVFNGNSFHISNLKISGDSQELAFIRRLGVDGTIKNVYFDNLTVKSTQSNISYARVAGIVSHMYGGTISNVYISGDIYGSDISSDSTITRYTAGIVAQMEAGTVVNCINNAYISLGSHIGGIVGCSTGGEIKYCINKAPVYTNNCNYIRIGGIAGELGGKANLSLCQNIGYVSISGSGINNASLGGIVGYSYSSRIIDQCVNSGNVLSGTSISDQTYAGGIVGYTQTNVTNCGNSGRIYSSAKETYNALSNFNINIKDTTYNEKQIYYYKYAELFWILRSLEYKYSREITSINYRKCNAYSGGIVGYGNGTLLISNCYNTYVGSDGVQRLLIYMVEKFTSGAYNNGGLLSGNIMETTCNTRITFEIKNMGAWCGTNANIQSCWAKSTVASEYFEAYSSNQNFTKKSSRLWSNSNNEFHAPNIPYHSFDKDQAPYSSGWCKKNISVSNGTYSFSSIPQINQDNKTYNGTGVDGNIITISSSNNYHDCPASEDSRFISSYYNGQLGGNLWTVKDEMPYLKNLYW